ncbi:MAG: thiol reductant ABC exporter subunit CydD [Acetobacteraceae bacterium]
MPDTTSQQKAVAACRRAWLKQVAAAGGWRNRAAAGLLGLDAVAAIGFAGGLAGGLTAPPHGLMAAAPWLALGLAASLARGGCAWGSARLGAAASRVARTTLRRHVVVTCLGLPPGERPPVGEMMTVAVDAVETIDGYVARFLPARRAAGLAPLLILAAAALASPVSAVILAGTLVPFIAVMALAGGAAADESRRQFSALARLSSLFADRVRTLPTVLAFQAEQAEADRLAKAAEELRRRTMGVLRIAFISSAGLEFFAALSVALVAVYAGFNLLGLLPFPSPERLDLGRAFFVLALAPEFYAPMRRLAAAYHDQQAAETAADQLMALEAMRQRPAPAMPAFTAAPRICFESVTVRFPGEAHAILDSIDFEAAPGKIVALLGPSGSGKTTVLNLLLGLVPLAGGEVWIDDLALSELGSAAGSVAWMGQTPVIVPGSIAENVALSRRDAPQADIEAVAKRVGLCAMLRARPGGLGALVDERGSGLSGGERRRIALARALLKPAPILLLDEPTAHLDAAAEAALIDAIRQAARGRTTIIATHSAALAAIADTVVRLGQP